MIQRKTLCQGGGASASWGWRTIYPEKAGGFPIYVGSNPGGGTLPSANYALETYNKHLMKTIVMLVEAWQPVQHFNQTIFGWMKTFFWNIVKVLTENKWYFWRPELAKSCYNWCQSFFAALMDLSKQVKNGIFFECISWENSFPHPFSILDLPKGKGPIRWPLYVCLSVCLYVTSAQP